LSAPLLLFEPLETATSPTLLEELEGHTATMMSEGVTSLATLWIVGIVSVVITSPKVWRA
jgi:hypothetical protein